MARLWQFAEGGNLPLLGGVLNQTSSFLEAYEQFSSDDAMWEVDRLNQVKNTDG